MIDDAAKWAMLRALDLNGWDMCRRGSGWYSFVNRSSKIRYPEDVGEEYPNMDLAIPDAYRYLAPDLNR